MKKFFESVKYLWTQQKGSTKKAWKATLLTLAGSWVVWLLYVLTNRYLGLQLLGLVIFAGSFWYTVVVINESAESMKNCLKTLDELFEELDEDEDA